MEHNMPASPFPATGGAPEGRTIGSRADVTTGVPARYADQLTSHLGRKLTSTGDATTSPATAAIGAASAGIAVADGVLTLWAAGDEASVARVEQVLGSYLERFAQRGALTVRGERTGGGAILILARSRSPSVPRARKSPRPHRSSPVQEEQS